MVPIQVAPPPPAGVKGVHPVTMYSPPPEAHDEATAVPSWVPVAHPIPVMENSSPYSAEPVLFAKSYPAFVGWSQIVGDPSIQPPSP